MPSGGTPPHLPDDLPVPESFRRLWRLPTPPQRRGRKSTLTVDTVVDTAVRLADEGGLEAATLPKVAKALGVTAMSLYRHVGSKHELLQLMLDAASEPLPATSTAPHWRDRLQSWASDLWSLYRDRPWLPHVPLHQAPSGPHQLRWLERGLAHLASTGLGWDERLSALTLLSGFVRQAALLGEELAEGREPGEQQVESERAYGAALQHVVDPERFPQLAAMLTAGTLADASIEQEPGERDFVRGLDIILDGLAARVADAPPVAD